MPGGRPRNAAALGLTRRRRSCPSRPELPATRAHRGRPQGSRAVRVRLPPFWAVNLTASSPFPRHEPADAHDLAAADAGFEADLLRAMLDRLDLAGVAIDEDPAGGDRQAPAGDLEQVGEAELPAGRLRGTGWGCSGCSGPRP